MMMINRIISRIAGRVNIWVLLRFVYEVFFFVFVLQRFIIVLDTTHLFRPTAHARSAYYSQTHNIYTVIKRTDTRGRA